MTLAYNGRSGFSSAWELTKCRNMPLTFSHGGFGVTLESEYTTRPKRPGAQIKATRVPGVHVCTRITDELDAHQLSWVPLRVGLAWIPGRLQERHLFKFLMAASESAGERTKPVTAATTRSMRQDAGVVVLDSEVLALLNVRVTNCQPEWQHFANTNSNTTRSSFCPGLQRLAKLIFAILISTSARLSLSLGG
eukprot:1647784-Rhodomonas_salina.2